MKRIVTRRVLLVPTLVLAVFVLVPVVVPFFHPWTALNCVHTDVNISTGHVRHIRFLWYLRVHKSVEDSRLSQVLALDHRAYPDDWRRALTLCIGQGHSPHFAYHGACTQIRRFEDLCEFQVLGDAQKIELAEELVTCWQSSVDDKSAEELLKKSWLGR